MDRYSVIKTKNPREIVLLQGKPCKWRQCTFCDYIADNSNDEEKSNSLNQQVLDQVTGEYKQLEVINSGSVFELTDETLQNIKLKVTEKEIERLYFEAHYLYKEKLHEIETYFERPIVFKCGIETFDEDFRNKVLRKGVVFQDPSEVAQYFQSICLMVGIQGQTRAMIEKDIDILLKYFKLGCVNIYTNNTTNIKADPALIAWFKAEYRFLAELPGIDVLWQNTGFGVGGA